MTAIDPHLYLSTLSYPGRGILLGVTPNSRSGILIYFIMGRSENSRNRIFVKEGSGLKTSPFDPSRLRDPSLIIYSPVRVYDGRTIVSNGDQTDTIYDTLRSGGSFEDALTTRCYEPDQPNFTPRISGLFQQMKTSVSYRLSILKAGHGNPPVCLRQFFSYDPAVPGIGHLIHTYKDDGDPLPSFEGEPIPVTLSEDFSDLRSAANHLWHHLDKDNRVALFARSIDLTTGEEETHIINRFIDNL